ncbi:hypothetical protein BOX15_Mlig027853g1 [Macrostomum lignano]|uniref:Uncharacterized protein n=1 Tax=Macrostomum lignano TaxID=282301 RepID=A0A267GLZ8_9PLAT|nr:hypothetical protein BOX15_Mlig027853g1 [Macrostomum lignano]
MQRASATKLSVLCALLLLNLSLSPAGSASIRASRLFKSRASGCPPGSYLARPSLLSVLAEPECRPCPSSEPDSGKPPGRLDWLYRRAFQLVHPECAAEASKKNAEGQRRLGLGGLGALAAGVAMAGAVLFVAYQKRRLTRRRERDGGPRSGHPLEPSYGGGQVRDAGPDWTESEMTVSLSDC